MTAYAMDVVNLTSILHFFNDFTKSYATENGKNIGGSKHRVGTVESKEFAQNISKNFRDFGLPQVG